MVLQTLSDDLAATVATAGPGVVRVEGRRRMPATGVVWSADGLIVTTHHVITRDSNVRVGLPDGETVDAALVGRDPSTDLAVLRVEASELLQDRGVIRFDLREAFADRQGGLRIALHACINRQEHTQRGLVTRVLRQGLLIPLGEVVEPARPSVRCKQSSLGYALL